MSTVIRCHIMFAYDSLKGFPGKNGLKERIFVEKGYIQGCDFSLKNVLSFFCGNFRIVW